MSKTEETYNQPGGRLACTIFYSWQSDLPNATNRGFIQKALEDAVKSIRDDDSVQVEPVIDRDTLDIPGAPDIAETILDKIEKSRVFVCDISIISQQISRPTPNPNVLIELGYALKALGWKRVIMVMNTSFGGPELLPFDLKMKRVVSYQMPEAVQDRASERKRLSSILKKAIHAVLTDMEKQIEHDDPDDQRNYARVTEPILNHPSIGHRRGSSAVLNLRFQPTFFIENEGQLPILDLTMGIIGWVTSPLDPFGRRSFTISDSLRRQVEIRDILEDGLLEPLTLGHTQAKVARIAPFQRAPLQTFPEFSLPHTFKGRSCIPYRWKASVYLIAKDTRLVWYQLSLEVTSRLLERVVNNPSSVDNFLNIEQLTETQPMVAWEKIDAN